MNLEFFDKTVVVTGAAHGIGRAITVAFADRGARVWGCDILEQELQETEGMCDCRTRVMDVTDRYDVEAFVGEVGRVDILVNNAGGVLGQVGRPIEEITPDEWRAAFKPTPRRRQRRSVSRVNSRTSWGRGESPSTTSRPGSFGRTPPPSASGNPTGPKANASSSTESRSSDSVRPTTSRMACCSSPRGTPAGSLARSCRLMGGSSLKPHRQIIPPNQKRHRQHGADGEQTIKRSPGPVP